jgi:putative transcriptional regulator
MSIITNLDVILAKRKMTLTQLSKAIGISLTNLSLLKTDNVKDLRYNTLEKICIVLDCQPGDILEYRPDEDEDENSE